jgi:hypothetical protein
LRTPAVGNKTKHRSVTKAKAKPPTDARLKCNDCGVDVLEIGEYYLLPSHIWKGELGLGWNDNLCIGCLETRLRRRISFDDGDLEIPPDYPRMRPISDRLLDRYGFVKDHKGKRPRAVAVEDAGCGCVLKLTKASRVRWVEGK